MVITPGFGLLGPEKATASYIDMTGPDHWAQLILVQFFVISKDCNHQQGKQKHLQGNSTSAVRRLSGSDSIRCIVNLSQRYAKRVFCFGSFIDFYAAAELQWEAEIQQGSTQAVVQRLDNTRRPQSAKVCLHHSSMDLVRNQVFSTPGDSQRQPEPLRKVTTFLSSWKDLARTSGLRCGFDLNTAFAMVIIHEFWLLRPAKATAFVSLWVLGSPWVEGGVESIRCIVNLSQRYAKRVFCFGSFIDFYAAAELQWEAEIQQGSTQAVVQRLDNTRRPQYAFEDSGLLPLKAASRFL
ncbi:hypothetical protein GQ457_02G031600 [Hibiscus cannabinus]